MFEPLASTMTRPILVLLLSLAGVSGARAQSPATAPAPVYDVSVRILAAERRLEISGEVTLPAPAATVSSIAFQLDYRFNGLEMTVRSPTSSAGPAKVSRNGNTATVTLAAPAPAGLPLVLQFRHFIDSGWTRSLHVDADGAYISGESFHWYPIPAANRRAKGRLRFVSPQGFNVAATGLRVDTNPTAGGIYEFQVNDLTTFSFAAGRHHVYRSEGNPTIALHLLRERPLIKERLDSLRRIVEALVEEFGPFPHPDLEIVEMPAAAAGGRDSAVSLEGFIVAGPAPVDSFNLQVLAHEISHQWWADCVFATGDGRVLLTEAMAEYGALRATEAIHGGKAAAEFRWRGYPGLSLFAGGRGYLSLVLADLDVALTAGTFPGILPVTKGMLVHDLLSRTVGRDPFRGFLQTFIREHAFQDTTWRTFTDEAARSLGGSLRSFFEQWYERKGVPELAVSWSQREGQLRGAITQAAPYYSAEIELLAEGGSESMVQRVRLDGDRTQFTWPVPFEIVSVRVDPDYKVPHRSADRMVDVSVIAPLAQALRLMTQGGTDFLTAAKSTFEGRLDDPGRAFVLEALQADDALNRGDNAAARRHIASALSNSYRLPEFVPGLYYAQAALARAAADRELMNTAAAAAIATDAALIAPTGWGLAARELLAQGGQ